MDQEENDRAGRNIKDLFLSEVIRQLPQAEGSQHGAEGCRQSDVPSLRQMMIERNKANKY